MTTNLLRKSTVTKASEKALSNEQQRLLAESTVHSLETVDKQYYDREREIAATKIMEIVQSIYYEEEEIDRTIDGIPISNFMSK